jgi:hypothetical protein
MHRAGGTGKQQVPPLHSAENISKKDPISRIRSPVPRLQRSPSSRYEVPVLPDWAHVWRAGPPGLESKQGLRAVLPCNVGKQFFIPLGGYDSP